MTSPLSPSMNGEGTRHRTKKKRPKRKRKTPKKRKMIARTKPDTMPMSPGQRVKMCSQEALPISVCKVNASQGLSIKPKTGRMDLPLIPPR